MLWYKAWMESRTRFAVALPGITLLSAWRVYGLNQLATSRTEEGYFYFALQGAHFLLCLMWIVAVTLLTMGGLLREKATGAVSFTLALPVSRRRLMGTRIGMGLAQAVALAALPWAAMHTTARLTGKADSLHNAVCHVGVMVGGGLLFYALALLLSSTVEGEYAAPLASLGLVFAMAILGDGALKAYNPLALMQGGEYLDKHTMQFVEPFPWARLAATVAVAAVLVGVSVKAVERREF
jgi:ABC-2 type transport system permease protein